MRASAAPAGRGWPSRQKRCRRPGEVSTTAVSSGIPAGRVAQHKAVVAVAGLVPGGARPGHHREGVHLVAAALDPELLRTVYQVCYLRALDEGLCGHAAVEQAVAPQPVAPGDAPPAAETSPAVPPPTTTRSYFTLPTPPLRSCPPRTRCPRFSAGAAMPALPLVSGGGSRWRLPGVVLAGKDQLGHRPPGHLREGVSVQFREAAFEPHVEGPLRGPQGR